MIAIINATILNDIGWLLTPCLVLVSAIVVYLILHKKNQDAGDSQNHNKLDNTFFKASIWSGAGWLLTLCVILISVTAIYLLLHRCYPGTDHRKLDTTQLANIDNILSGFSNTDTVVLKTKADTAQRKKRDQMVFAFLRNEYDNQIDEASLTRMGTLLIGLNAKDVKLYLTSKDITVHDFFWFNGSFTYLEVLFWALVGVLVSLVYYVSLANATNSSSAGDTDTGPFDPSKISEQVAKMFYAPVCALVLVLGYNLINSDNKMTDISIGKGLLLFSFICGFFSGRVMKFIDKLKDLVLPLGADTDGSNVATATTTDVTVKLQLAAAISQSADGPDIIEGGFNKAVVTLQPAAGGDIITLTAPEEDQGASFTTKQLPFGKYTLKATMAYSKAGATTDLSANQDITVSATSNSFDLLLDKTANG